jgi:hypothetical protein
MNSFNDDKIETIRILIIEFLVKLKIKYRNKNYDNIINEFSEEIARLQLFNN